MTHTLLFDSIIDGFPSPTLTKQMGKPDYASTRDTRRLLTKNTDLIKIPHRGVHNGHLELVLTAAQYTHVIPVPFVCPIKLG